MEQGKREPLYLMAGKSLTLLTVSKNDSVVIAPDPSVTVSVTVDEPKPLLPGVIVTVRLAPVPLIAMFAPVTNAASSEHR